MPWQRKKFFYSSRLRKYSCPVNGIRGRHAVESKMVTRMNDTSKMCLRQLIPWNRYWKLNTMTKFQLLITLSITSIEIVLDPWEPSIIKISVTISIANCAWLMSTKSPPFTLFLSLSLSYTHCATLPRWVDKDTMQREQINLNVFAMTAIYSGRQNDNHY